MIAGLRRLWGLPRRQAQPDDGAVIGVQLVPRQVGGTILPGPVCL